MPAQPKGKDKWMPLEQEGRDSDLKKYLEAVLFSEQTDL